MKIGGVIVKSTIMDGNFHALIGEFDHISVKSTLLWDKREKYIYICIQSNIFYDRTRKRSSLISSHLY